MAIGKSPLVPPPGQPDQFKYSYNEREMLNRMMEEKVKASEIERLTQMVNAMNMNVASGMDASVRSLETLKQVIDRKIEEHKKMISTLEWFSAHVKLDDPEADQLLVGRIILSGLEAMYKEKQLR